MGYERLKVTDHVDKWTASKLRHVEDGIIANENELKNKQPKGNYATETYVKTLIEELKLSEKEGIIALTIQEILDICK